MRPETAVIVRMFFLHKSDQYCIAAPTHQNSQLAASRRSAKAGTCLCVHLLRSAAPVPKLQTKLWRVSYRGAYYVYIPLKNASSKPAAIDNSPWCNGRFRASRASSPLHVQQYPLIHCRACESCGERRNKRITPARVACDATWGV